MLKHGNETYSSKRAMKKHEGMETPALKKKEAAMEKKAAKKAAKPMHKMPNGKMMAGAKHKKSK